MAKGPLTGATMTQKISDVIAATLTKHKAASLPGELGVRSTAFRASVEEMERELAPSIESLWAGILDDPEVPESFKSVLAKGAAPEHQVDFVVGLAAAFVGLFGTLSAIGQYEFAHLIQHFAAKLTPYPLAPAEAALAVVRGIIGQEEGAGNAALSGISGGVFDVMVKNTGEPPAIQELLLLWRRGQIDTAQLEHGIRQSRVKNEWIPAVKDLRFYPPSPQEAIAAEVEGHLSEAEAKKIMGESGLDPSNHDWLYETAGRPPGPAEMGDMFHRGIISEGIFRQGIRESDVKNKYIDDLVKASEYLPPVRSIGILLRHNAITEQQAAMLWQQNGVPQWLAAAYVRVAQDQQSSATKDLAFSQVRLAYQDRIITRDEAKSMVKLLGYSDANAEIEITIVDFARAQQYQNVFLSRIHSLFVSHKINDEDMQSALSGADVPVDQRAQLIQIWGLERDANVRTLTEAQVIAAAKKKVITGTQAGQQLVNMGYTAEDAGILLATAGL